MTAYPIQAFERRKDEAVEALAILRSWDRCSDMPRVPGMDTVIRLAVRIDQGRTIDEAAAREYLYRWNLALISPLAFGAPGLLGP